jgi:hypothetical protein
VINETTTYTMLGRNGEQYEIPDAIQAAPGLVVFRLPHGLSPADPPHGAFPPARRGFRRGPLPDPPPGRGAGPTTQHTRKQDS